MIEPVMPISSASGIHTKALGGLRPLELPTKRRTANATRVAARINQQIWARAQRWFQAAIAVSGGASRPMPISQTSGGRLPCAPRNHGEQEADREAGHESLDLRHGVKDGPVHGQEAGCVQPPVRDPGPG